MRDTFEFMDDGRRQRERFGDNESVRELDVTLILRQDRTLSLMVHRPEQTRDEPWISLPKSLIEYEIASPGCVVVRIKETLAKEKGLI